MAPARRGTQEPGPLQRRAMAKPWRMHRGDLGRPREGVEGVRAVARQTQCRLFRSRRAPRARRTHRCRRSARLQAAPGPPHHGEPIPAPEPALMGQAQRPPAWTAPRRDALRRGAVESAQVPRLPRGAWARAWLRGRKRRAACGAAPSRSRAAREQENLSATAAAGIAGAIAALAQASRVLAPLCGSLGQHVCQSSRAAHAAASLRTAASPALPRDVLDPGFAIRVPSALSPRGRATGAPGRPPRPLRSAACAAGPDVEVREPPAPGRQLVPRAVPASSDRLDVVALGVDRRAAPRSRVSSRRCPMHWTIARRRGPARPSRPARSLLARHQFGSRAYVGRRERRNPRNIRHGRWRSARPSKSPLQGPRLMAISQRFPRTERHQYSGGSPSARLERRCTHQNAPIVRPSPRSTVHARRASTASAVGKSSTLLDANAIAAPRADLGDHRCTTSEGARHPAARAASTLAPKHGTNARRAGRSPFRAV